MEQEAIITSAEGQLRNFGNFLDEFDIKLRKLLPNETKFIPDKPIVQVDYSKNVEHLTLLRLLESDRLLNKTLLTFAYLCQEVHAISEEAKTMQIKFLYLDEDLCLVASNDSRTDNGSLAKDQTLLKMSNSMEFLCNMQFLIQRCMVLGSNLLQQCGATFQFKEGSIDMKFYNVFDSLVDILVELLIFDELLLSSNFRGFWGIYKKTLEAITFNKKLTNQYTKSEMIGLQNCLQNMEFLFAGNIFRYFLGSVFIIKEKIGAKAMGQLTQQFNEYMKQNLTAVEKFNSEDLNELYETKKLVQLNVFCVLFHDFCGQVETKNVKQLLEFNNKYLGIMLIANVPWVPSTFLRKHAESLVKSHEKLMLDVKKQNQNYLQQQLQNLQNQCHSYCNQISLWSINIKGILNLDAFNLDVAKFKDLASTLLVGLRYAGQISFLIKAVINTHVSLQVPMNKHTLLSVCKLLELLKLIKITFERHTYDVSKIIQCIQQYLQYKILQRLADCKKKVTSVSKLHNSNIDVLAAIKLAEKCMNGPVTFTRLLVAKLAINATNTNDRFINVDKYEKLEGLIQRVELLSGIQKHLEQLCDTSYLYWHQSILKSYLKQIVDRNMNFNSFQYVISCFNDCGQNFDLLGLNNLNIKENFNRANFEAFRTEIVSKLCAKIETFLRLEAHTNLQLDKMNPFEQGIDDYRDLINLCPIEINGHYIILKDQVENYLSAMFYNLTSISLNDWKTYKDMRLIADERLELQPVDDYLPSQTLEQGVDILEIMRNIHIFVSKYVYGIHSQVFIERESSNKYLETFGITHMANSLRTHGSGVINTTVNFTYQYLRQKFYTVSQFLYDEQIKSRVIREYNEYEERKSNKTLPLYPYERAISFNKDVRNLGLADDGQSYMDLFRKVITHIGNALGYIRLIRSGNIDANYDAIQYLPPNFDTIKFVELCKESQLPETTIEAAENLEFSIKNLLSTFSDSTNYLKLLVKAFTPFFNNEKNNHLKNFYLILPSLMLNFVEHIYREKDKVNKKDPNGGIIFDDGFALGVAYLLKVLEQHEQFNSLHWFDSVRERFEAESKKVEDMLRDASKTKGLWRKSAFQKKEEQKLQETLTLTNRRIEGYQREFDLLYYTINSAKLFFF